MAHLPVPSDKCGSNYYHFDASPRITGAIDHPNKNVSLHKCEENKFLIKSRGANCPWL